MKKVKRIYIFMLALSMMFSMMPQMNVFGRLSSGDLGFTDPMRTEWSGGWWNPYVNHDFTIHLDLLHFAGEDTRDGGILFNVKFKSGGSVRFAREGEMIWRPV